MTDHESENHQQSAPRVSGSQRGRYRKYDAQFKQEAVRLAETSDRSKSSVARSLGITPNMLHQWRKQYGSPASSAQPQSSSPAVMPSVVEMELRKQLRNAEMERDI